jgi:hypothetical protein
MHMRKVSDVKLGVHLAAAAHEIISFPIQLHAQVIEMYTNTFLNPATTWSAAIKKSRNADKGSKYPTHLRGASPARRLLPKKLPDYYSHFRVPEAGNTDARR